MLLRLQLISSINFCKNKFFVKITESLSMHAKETNQIDCNPAKENRTKKKENVLQISILVLLLSFYSHS